MTRPFLIDTDTASDDAVALIMALRAPDVDVRALTIVSGNVDLQQGLRNALTTLELCGRTDIPVYAGADRPLLRAAERAEWFHGVDGMGDMNYPPPRAEAAPGHGVDALVATIRDNPGIVLVTLGPLTNVALALARAPEIARLVSRCVVSGRAPPGPSATSRPPPSSTSGRTLKPRAWSFSPACQWNWSVGNCAASRPA